MEHDPIAIGRRIFIGGGTVLLGFGLAGQASGHDGHDHGGADEASIRPIASHPPMPPLFLPTMDGTDYDLSTSMAEGKAAIVAFWATWCAPCRRELPSLARMTASRSQNDLAVALVNFGESRDRIDRFMQEVDLGGLPVLLDEERATARPWRVGALPVAYLISPQGTVDYQIIGEIDWESPAITARLDALAAGNQSAN